ncbi:hypothetical protein NMG60_11032787 [Bertholletia excelsa]
MGLRRGEQVEVVSKEEGFVGSYYAATVIAEIKTRKVMVQYKKLLKEDESGPLIEIVARNDLRPVPPEIPANGFDLFDRVDAFDNDGWWVGKISGRVGSMYYVYFETTGEEIAYSLDRLRIHQDWLNDKWVSSKEGAGEITNALK